MNQRMGLTTHAAWLQQNPDGSQLAVVVVDGPGASEFLGKLATSDHAFDTWFRTNVEDIHPMDFSAPPPPAPVRFLRARTPGRRLLEVARGRRIRSANGKKAQR